jgi:tripartite ATP-independent transporter DctM subunit
MDPSAPPAAQPAAQAAAQPDALPAQGTYKGFSTGVLAPASGPEAAWNFFMRCLLRLSAVITGLLAIPICLDIVARTFFGFAIEGIIEIETLSLVPLAFCSTGFLTVSRQHIQIDLFFNMFKPRLRGRLLLLANLTGFCVSAAMACQTFATGMEQTELTPFLYLPVRWFILMSSFGFFCAGVSFLFQVFHSLRDLLDNRDRMGILLPLAGIALIIALPFLYKASGVRFSGLIIGGLGFLALFSLLLIRVPIAFAMMFMGILGLICLKRTPFIALAAVGDIPYLHIADFVYVAIPMFMLMGELAFFSGISADLFECANRWLGRLAGGLAAATVGGCAGFGAVCGESLPTVITMSAVALPPMRDHHYHPGLSTGVLAAGGTLGILIPPSIGFIFYSIVTEESVGRLFIAGIIPGLLLSAMFILTIIVQVKRRPELAPKGKSYSLREKITSLLYLLPMGALFTLVIGGILSGSFTPGEGGAVGAMGAFLYSVARRRMSPQILKDALRATVLMSGKIFMIFAGVYCFGAFLSSSRLPNLLADTIIGLDVNRYFVLCIIIALYIALGAVMNILPMMLLTLPSIYPTVQALQFDGIWFGVITVMLMEMGLITPPVGMNVFTLSSLAPDIPMAVIFRGVMPFVLTMLVTIILIIIFPGIATWLPDMLLPALPVR